MKKICSAVIAILTFLAMTTIIGSAGPDSAVGSGCRANTNVPTYSFLSPSTSIAGNVVTYMLSTVTKTGASVIEYCVYPNPGFSGSDSDLNSLFVGPINPWVVDRVDTKPYFGFSRGGGGDPNNLPIDGTKNINIGTADYKSADKVPKNEIILFHINDPATCQATDASDTCWRRSGPTPPIPELSTIILVPAGLFGLVVLSRKYKNG